jgi:hypothetical protein
MQRESGRFIVRPHTWLQPYARLECPRGHVIRTNAIMLEQGAYICQHRAAPEQGECGMRVYVLQMDDGRKYVVEVTPAETMHMKDKNMGPEQALEYLSSSPPRKSVA